MSLASTDTSASWLDAVLHWWSITCAAESSTLRGSKGSDEYIASSVLIMAPTRFSVVRRLRFMPMIVNGGHAPRCCEHGLEGDSNNDNDNDDDTQQRGHTLDWQQTVVWHTCIEWRRCTAQSVVHSGCSAAAPVCAWHPLLAACPPWQAVGGT